MKMYDAVTDLKKLFEDNSIFKPATPENLAKREVDRQAAMVVAHKEFSDKVGRAAGALGFQIIGVEEDRYSTEDRILINATKGGILLRFKKNSNTRLAVSADKVSIGGGRYWGAHSFFASMKVSDQWLIKEIQDKLLAKMQPGDAGWKAKHITSMRFKKQCNVCYKEIPSQTKFFRLANGQAVCLDCVKKAASLLQESLDEAGEVFKPATPENLKNRGQMPNPEKVKALAEGKVWCNNCNKVPPHLSIMYEWAQEDATLENGRIIGEYHGINDTGDRSSFSCGECYDEHSLENTDKIEW